LSQSNQLKPTSELGTDGQSKYGAIRGTQLGLNTDFRYVVVQ